MTYEKDFVKHTNEAATDHESNQIKIKSSLYSPYYAEACNELRGPSPRLSAWATQLRRNVATVASRWRHYVDLTGPGIESRTSRTDSVRLATEQRPVNGPRVMYYYYITMDELLSPETENETPVVQ